MNNTCSYIGSRQNLLMQKKVTGKAKYLDDMVLPGILYKNIASSHPHAKILKIDVTEAEALPGVKL